MLQIINKVFKTSIVKWVSDKHIMITDHWWLCKFFFVFTYRLYCIRICQPNKIYLLTVSENGSTFISLFRLFWIFLWPLPYDAKCRQFGWDFITSEFFWIIDIKTNWIRSFYQKWKFDIGWYQEKICGSTAWCLALLHAFRCFYSGLSKSVHVFCECLS